MSGINEFKKKVKLSMDEMYDNQVVGKMETQEENKQDNQTVVQPENHMDYKQHYQSNQQSLFLSPKQVTQKVPTYKMTFSLTEEIYTAFNDLYAKRILQGRKTDKSELICEAIQWLIQMEKNFTK